MSVHAQLGRFAPYVPDVNQEQWGKFLLTVQNIMLLMKKHCFVLKVQLYELVCVVFWIIIFHWSTYFQATDALYNDVDVSIP